MTVRTKRLSLAGASVAVAITVGVLGVTAAQGDNVLAIPLPTVGDVIGTAVIALVGFGGKRVLRLLDTLADGIGELQRDVRELKTVINGRGGIIDDVRDLQATVYRTPVAPPAGFSVSPMHNGQTASKEPT